MRNSIGLAVGLLLVFGGFTLGLVFQPQSGLQDTESFSVRKVQEAEPQTEPDRPADVARTNWIPLSPDCGLAIVGVSPEGQYGARLMARVRGKWSEIYLKPGPAELVYLR